MTNPEAFAKQLYIRQVFNMAGLLPQKKEADPDLIFKLYTPNAIIPTWEQFEPIVQATREDHRFPEHYEPFEFLYNEAKKRYPEISLKRIEERRALKASISPYELRPPYSFPHFTFDEEPRIARAFQSLAWLCADAECPCLYCTQSKFLGTEHGIESKMQ
jgi:hypothetical protein